MRTPDLDGMPKPMLRGVVHQYASAVAFGAGLVLVVRAPTMRATGAVAVFTVSLVIQFGISALLHRGDWSPEVERWLRRLDHSAIFVLIAGSYTPFAMVGFPTDLGAVLLVAVWAGAAIGVLYSMVGVQQAKLWRALLALAVGWTIVPFIPEVRLAHGDGVFGMLLAGGCLYSVGAVVYATERPSLWPRTFGFHEAFHVLTVVAAALHFASVMAIVA